MEFVKIHFDEALVIIGVLAGAVASVCRREDLTWKQVLQELVLSWLCALVVYGICRHIQTSEWMIVSLCSIASYSGSKLLPFFMNLVKMTSIAWVESKFSVDVDDNELLNDAKKFIKTEGHPHGENKHR